MKKTTSIIGTLSLAVVILLSAFTAEAKKNKSAVNNMKVFNLGVYGADKEINEWAIAYNGNQQQLAVTQTSGDVLPAKITITSMSGNVIYSSKLSGNINNIDLASLQAGKYKVYLENNQAREEYKLAVRIL